MTIFVNKLRTQRVIERIKLGISLSETSEMQEAEGKRSVIFYRENRDVEVKLYMAYPYSKARTRHDGQTYFTVENWRLIGLHKRSV